MNRHEIPPVKPPTEPWNATQSDPVRPPNEPWMVKLSIETDIFAPW